MAVAAARSVLPQLSSGGSLELVQPGMSGAGSGSPAPGWGASGAARLPPAAPGTAATARRPRPSRPPARPLTAGAARPPRPAGVLGENVKVVREKTKITVTSEVPMSKRYLKYLTKKFLKKARACSASQRRAPAALAWARLAGVLPAPASARTPGTHGPRRRPPRPPPPHPCPQHNVRDWLRVIASGKDRGTYELRYFNIADQEEGDEEDEE